jgi:hypothetical protein
MNTFFILLSIALIALLLAQRNKLAKTNEEKEEIRGRFMARESELSARIDELNAKVGQLSKYQTIIDAEAKAREVLNEAAIQANALREEANSAIVRQQYEAEEARARTREEIKELKERAERIMETATQQAARIIADANVRAEEIAGDAYEALKRADSLEKTAKALRNIIEGYGDQYIIPSFSLLDQLADEYGYTEAGEELKKSRERMRLMIKSGTAASCDYVEANRKETAINFVLDAFNGKVDTILSGVKHDNHGTLSQKIRDSFYTVNNNGKAFRNAAITQEYLSERLEELKWAATVQELRLKEREEQRMIKEQIREEEKARRDFERAIKEAAKEEEMLKKAMERIQRELGLASEDQKAKYESQLAELGDRLRLAEEKNQRALSMAQQTRTGHVYVISNIGSFGEDVYKVGMTRRLEPLDRIRELGDASVPFAFDVHSMILSDDAPTLERELHKKFVRMQMNKVNARKEFFRISLKEIKDEIEKLGIEVKWTMVSEAREYRESLAIEEAFRNHTLNEEEWAKRTIEHIPLEIEEEEDSVS